MAEEGAKGADMPKKILLADDSVTIQKVVELTFAEGDYEVTCVSNGKAAIERLQAARPDIMLCDIIMPEVSGYDVAQFVKKNPVYSAIPVILLTGTFEPFDEEKARLSGADTYITKPFDSRMLVEKVESLLAKRLVMDTTAPAPSFEVVARQEMTVRPQEAESPFSPASTAPAAASVAPEQVFEAAFESEPDAAKSPQQFVPQPAAPSFEPAEPKVFEAAAFEPEPQAAAAEPPVQESPFEAAFEPAPPAQPDEAPAATAQPPEPAQAFEAAVEPGPGEVLKAPEPPQPQAAAAEPPIMDVAMLGTQPVPESVFEGLAEAPAQTQAPEPLAPQPISASPEATLIASSSAFGEEIVLPEDIAPAKEEAATEQAKPAEPPASAVAEPAPFTASQPEEQPAENEAPLLEEPAGEMELESSAWLQAEAKTPEPVAPDEGIVHDMSEQQEMVAEAQKLMAPREPAETVIEETPSPEQAPFWEEKIEEQPISEESTIETARVAHTEDTSPAEVVAQEPRPSGAEVPPAPSSAAVPDVAVTPAQIEAIVRKVVEEMAPEILRQVAWETIPELAESLIKRRIQELEAQAE